MTAPETLPPLQHFHHVAFRCRDAEQTRHFYQDVLGLPLSAGLAFDEVSGTDTQLRYLHIFFGLVDGSFIAFFDAPDSATEEHFKRRSGFNRHLAIQAGSLEVLATYQQRLRANGVPCDAPLDHSFVKSIYFFDPNGIQLETTARTEQYGHIMADEAAKAADELARWTRATAGQKHDRGLILTEFAARAR